METFYIRQNDARQALDATLVDAAGAAIDLTGATVILHVGTEGEPASKLLTGTCSITNAEAGTVRFLWLAAHTALEPGRYDAAFTVTWTDGTVRTVPTRGGQFQVVVVGEVG